MFHSNIPEYSCIHLGPTNGLNRQKPGDAYMSVGWVSIGSGNGLLPDW